MKKVILIKYGELTTKKDNRKFFIKTLKNNIIDKLNGYNILVTDDYYRMFIEVEEDDVIEPTISRIEVLEDTTETVDDKSNEEVVKEILDDANEIVSNYKEDKIVEEETETVTITVDNVETSTIEIVTEDNATTVNTNKTKEEKPVQSFIKVLDEDDNELDRMRESLLDDEYDDQYDEMYDQAMRESKIRNNRMS